MTDVSPSSASALDVNCMCLELGASLCYFLAHSNFGESLSLGWARPRSEWVSFKFWVKHFISEYEFVSYQCAFKTRVVDCCFNWESWALRWSCTPFESWSLIAILLPLRFFCIVHQVYFAVKWLHLDHHLVRPGHNSTHAICYLNLDCVHHMCRYFHFLGHKSMNCIFGLYHNIFWDVVNHQIYLLIVVLFLLRLFKLL